MTVRHSIAFKRFIDIIGATALLVLTSPIMLLTAAAIRLRLGSPVLFRQPRLGYRERTFEVLKFRTMTNTKSSDGSLLPDAQRITRLGSFIRTTSLDELPQLWNVLKGDMSLVGPRPLFVHYREYYTDRERRRHCVRPGITGLAQVSGRNTLLWDDRLALDVEYVDRLSLALDVRILALTARKVLARGDIHVIPGLAQGPLTQYRTKRTIPDTPICP